MNKEEFNLLKYTKDLEEKVYKQEFMIDNLIRDKIPELTNRIYALEDALEDKSNNMKGHLMIQFAIDLLLVFIIFFLAYKQDR